MAVSPILIVVINPSPQPPKKGPGTRNVGSAIARISPEDEIDLIRSTAQLGATLR
jgi:hypothetical protein